MTIPEITKKFVREIGTKAKKGNYEVKVGNIKITVFPNVFPPQSSFSESSHSVYEEFGNLVGKRVLDIGTGTGIQAIKAIRAGAKYVEAVDIYPLAVECAKYNINRNGHNGKINVFESDMFSNVPKKRYNLIIANLPIIDYPEEDVRLHSLFDPNFRYHERLFQDASKYLSRLGKIILCHANLDKKASFKRLEGLAKTNGFSSKVDKSINALSYEWRTYNFEMKLIK